MKRSMFTLILTITLIALAPHLDQVAANQQGPGVGDQLTGWAILCQLNGGKETVDTSSRTVKGLPKGSVKCTGGYLDGLFCEIFENPNSSYCTMNAPSGPLATSGVDAGSLPIISTVPEPVATVDPSAVEPLVIAEAQVAWPATEGVSQGIAVATVHTCALGGGEAIASTRVPEVQSALTIRCEGGVFAGDVCDFTAGLVSCFNESGATVVEQTSDQGEMQATEPVSKEPTVAPTMAATEPMATAPATAVSTDEPVIEPTFAPTDAGPWTVPDGTLPVFEPVEPTPTEVILT